MLGSSQQEAVRREWQPHKCCSLVNISWGKGKKLKNISDLIESKRQLSGGKDAKQLEHKGNMRERDAHGNSTRDLKIIPMKASYILTGIFMWRNYQKLDAGGEPTKKKAEWLPNFTMLK